MYEYVLQLRPTTYTYSAFTTTNIRCNSLIWKQCRNYLDLKLLLKANQVYQTERSFFGRTWYHLVPYRVSKGCVRSETRARSQFRTTSFKVYLSEYSETTFEGIRRLIDENLPPTNLRRREEGERDKERTLTRTKGRQTDEPTI
jgi:hypothetical protein